MKEAGGEFFSLPHVTCISARSGLMGGKGNWEVFVRLSSGSIIVLAAGGKRKQARVRVKETAGNISAATGRAFIVSEDMLTFIAFEHVTRIYIDRQENSFLLLCEDAAGITYEIRRGSEQQCKELLHNLAETLIAYQAGARPSEP